MARPKKLEEKTVSPKRTPVAGSVNLSALMQRPTNRQHFSTWIVGTTPLICHAWSEKAKREMLAKQVKAVKGGKEARNPENDFHNSLYNLGNNRYGFPVTAVKKAIIAVAHKDKGIAKEDVKKGLWLDHEMVRVAPALAGAICDMPIIRIYGSDPEMREDMVRVGAGATGTASLAYRAQFKTWALFISGTVNIDVIDAEALAFLTRDAGTDCGIGDWRNEKSGVFGAFRLADVEEAALWDMYRLGKGKLPMPARDLRRAA